MLCRLYATKADGGICDVYDRGGTISGRLLRQVKRFDDLIDEGYEAVGHGTSQIVEQARQLDQGVSRAYREVGGQVHTVAHGMSVVDAAVGEAYEQVGKAAARVPEDLNKLEGIGSTASTFSLQNVTIGSLIVAVILLIILTIMYIYGGQVL